MIFKYNDNFERRNFIKLYYKIKDKQKRLKYINNQYNIRLYGPYIYDTFDSKRTDATGQYSIKLIVCKNVST